MNQQKMTEVQVIALSNNEKLKRILRAAFAALGAAGLVRMFKVIAWKRTVDERLNGPPAALILGNLGDLYQHGGRSAAFFEYVHSNWGDMVRFWVGPYLHISIADPEMAIEAYRKCTSRPIPMRRFLSFLGDTSIRFQHGANASRMRMHFGQMIGSYAAMHRMHSSTVSTFSKYIRNWKLSSVEIFEQTGPLLYESFGQALFGSFWSADIGRYLFECHETIAKNGPKWSMHPVGPIWDAEFREFQRMCHRMYEICRKIVDGYLNEKEKGGKAFQTDSVVLSHLFNSTDKDGSEAFTAEEATSVILDLLNGAYLPTKSALSWAMVNLARNGDVQRKLHEEIFDNLGSRLTPGMDDLKDLIFFDAVIQESMRLNSTIGMNERVNLEESIFLQGHQIPRGTIIDIPIFLTMRDGRWFGPDPEHFVPERFMGDSAQAILARKCFMAFGAQSRMCIGFSLALAGLKSALCTILQRYRIDLDGTSDCPFEFRDGVCLPNEKVYLRFEAHPEIEVDPLLY